MAVTVVATVHQTTPLLLDFDGDSTNHVPAVRLRTYTPVLADRVRVEVRTPLPPLVLARVGS